MQEYLPGFVLADLYSKSLVFIDDEIKQQTEKNSVQNTNTYLGNYVKKIIVLVNNADNSYINDADLNFLSGILKACQLNLADIALINFNNNPVSFLYLKKEMKVEFLLSFGVTALQIELPFDMPLYQVQHYDNCQIVITPSLTALNQQTQESKTEKTKLWKSLQKMFSLEK